MVRRLTTLAEVADQFDAIVLDQWGVLHDGTVPYPAAPDALASLNAAGMRLAVLSNSGKRAAPNRARIAEMGFPPTLFEVVMTSGEALWSEVAAHAVPPGRFYPIARAPGDAEAWAKGLDISMVDSVDAADAILLMGLPDGAEPEPARAALDEALSRALPVYCTNPDRASPRANGAVVTSPGALAHDHVARGGDVRFYGKPHLPVFRAVEAALDVAPERLLMVGDSLEHDIAGGAAAGWATAFVEGGLHAAHFSNAHDPLLALTDLAAADAAPLPTYSLPRLQ